MDKIRKKENVEIVTMEEAVKIRNEIIEKHSNEGDLVMDCFSGSGTTAVACILTNRRFCGCEISKKYYDKSIDRVNEYQYITERKHQ